MENYHTVSLEILSHGGYTKNRTGVDTITLFRPDKYKKFDLQKGFPLLTTKKMDGPLWKSLVSELVWYISGKTSIKEFNKHSGIWKAWDLGGEDVGAAYPWQLRQYEGVDFKTKQVIKIDQLKNLVEGIKQSPQSRRHIISYWNPAQVRQGIDVGLPACHAFYNFHVQDGKLSLSMTQRSCDMFLGVPFNIAHSALLTHLIARETGLGVGHFAHTLVNAHFYCGAGEHGEFYKQNIGTIQTKLGAVQSQEDYLGIKDFIESNAPAEKEGLQQDHVTGILEQLAREPYTLPVLDLSNLATGLFDLTFDDVAKIKLKEYQSHPRIKRDIAV